MTNLSSINIVPALRTTQHGTLTETKKSQTLNKKKRNVYKRPTKKKKKKKVLQQQHK